MRLPPEAAKVRLTCQVLREKTELDERPYPLSKQRINQLINILPIEDQAAVLPPANEHVVVQETMEAKISHSAML